MIYNYVYSGSRMIARMGSGVINWYLGDRLSERLVLDANANVIGRMAHLPFGEDFGETGTQEKHHFTSYEREGESGFDYAINRHYALTIGRFLQADPYRPSGFLIDPRSWNRYSYTRNIVTNRVDALGLEDKPPKFICDNCVVNISPGADPIGNTGLGLGGLLEGIGRDVKGPPLVDGHGGGPGQSLWEILKKWWNELNKCEKALSPAALPSVYYAAQTAVGAEHQIRGTTDPDDDDYANAVKHCVWSCIMTIKLDLSIAKAWGNAHESDPKNGCILNTDVHSEMDLHNNDVGRTIGYNLASSGSSDDCVKRCKKSPDICWIKGSGAKASCH